MAACVSGSARRGAAATELSPGERTDAEARRLQSLMEVRRRLRACTTPGALFSTASDLASAECGFDRALVLVLDGSALTVASTTPLRMRASDRLRRSVAACPVTVPHDSREMELICPGAAGTSNPGSAPSVLAPTLRLRRHLLAAIPRSEQSAAILLVDRRLREIDGVDRALIELLAADIANVLAMLDLRAKARELGHRVQLLSSSSDRAVEAILAPVTLRSPREGRGTPSGSCPSRC